MSCCWDPLGDEGERKKGRLQAEAEAPPSLYRVSKDRKCTDLWALLLYLLSWGGLIAILVVALKGGADPQRVIRGVDFQGRTCGVSEGVRDQPLAAWIAMPLNLEPGVDCTDCYAIMTCVTNCTQTSDHPLIVDHYTSEQFLSYCVATGQDWAYNTQFQSASTLAARTFADLYTCWRAILFAACASIVVSFVYTWCSKEWAGLMVGLACLATIAAGVIVTWALFAQAAFKANTASPRTATALQIVGAFVGAGTLAFICILIAIRRELNVGVKLAKEGAKAVMKIPQLILFPLLPTLVGVGYVAFFVWLTVLICSVWNTSPANFPSYITQKAPQLYGNAAGALYPQTQTHTTNQALLNSFAFLLPHLLWTMSIVTYTIYATVSAAVARRYFSAARVPRLKARNDEEKRRFKRAEAAMAKEQRVWISDEPVTDAFIQTIRYHIGTVMVAALLMGILNTLRAVITYLQTKVNAGGDMCCVPYRLQNAICCITRCLLGMTTCCLTQVNSSALIFSSILATDFLESCRGSFQLLFVNLGTAAVLKLVVTYLFFCGKIFVAAGTTAIMALVLPHYYPALNSPILPLVTVFLASWLSASAFMGVLEIATETTFLCFIIDEQAHAASGAMHASARLQALIYETSESKDPLAMLAPAPSLPPTSQTKRPGSGKKKVAAAVAGTVKSTKVGTRAPVASASSKKKIHSKVTTTKKTTRKEILDDTQVDVELV
jgi:hypothetical protein